MPNILAVVAHPDDEVLGCGATLADHVERGDRVSVLILGRFEQPLVGYAERAAEILGTCPPHFCALEDQKFDTYPLLDIVQKIEREKYEPDIVYTHYPYDLNLDHEITARAVLTAFRPIRPMVLPTVPSTVPTILAFETLSSTEWGPQPPMLNWFVVPSESAWRAKKLAMREYKTELRSDCHPRSILGIENQARRRGYQCGHDGAEGFVVLRHVVT